MAYALRLIDADLDELLPELAAIAIEGAKGVGKTATARRRAASELAFDVPAVRAAIGADPTVILGERRPLLLDEWQWVPETWDVVRRAVDADPRGGQFIFTGSASAQATARIHSGAGRIVRFRMRPMALCERGVAEPSMSLRALLTEPGIEITGSCDLTLREYTREVLASGLPGVRSLSDRARGVALDGYLARVVDQDLPEIGVDVRRPHVLRSWLTAYSAATSTTTAYTRILDAATPGEGEKPNRQTVDGYRETLQRVWLLDRLPPWSATFSHLKRLTQSPKHHLLDPALAARLLGATSESLLRGEGKTLGPRDGTLLGALFESLATLTVRAIASTIEAKVGHLRTQNGDHEVDLIVERPDGKVVAIEVKLASAVTDKDVVHLQWLADRLGDSLVNAIVLYTGPFAYRRRDGIGVVPLGLLAS